MLHHDRTPYRWQDHAVTPRRMTATLLASVLVLAVIGGLSLAHHGPHMPPVIAAHATDWMPPLAQTTKRTAPHSWQWLGGC